MRSRGYKLWRACGLLNWLWCKHAGSSGWLTEFFSSYIMYLDAKLQCEVPTWSCFFSLIQKLLSKFDQFTGVDHKGLLYAALPCILQEVVSSTWTCDLAASVTSCAKASLLLNDASVWMVILVITLIFTYLVIMQYNWKCYWEITMGVRSLILLLRVALLVLVL